MAGYAIEGLLEFGQWDVLGLIHPENAKNLTRWEAIRVLGPENARRFEIELSPTQSVKFNAVRRYFKPAALRRLKARILDYQPDVILLIQGNIEQGSALFSLMPGLPCPVVSYIPVPHTHAEMGAKLGRLRDLTCRSFYNKPDGFITISDTLAAQLKEYGAKGRLQVVQNGISLERFESLPDRTSVCAEYQLPQDAFIWAHIGRIEFKQKGQDLSLVTFKERQKTHPNEALVFVGSGPDSDALLAEITGMSGVYHIPWLNEVGNVFPAINGLILPSKYEGVPLVMLEALANGIPVIGADRDGMVDWLPDDWRFDPQQAGAMDRAMDCIRKSDASLSQTLKSRVEATCALPVFKQAFNGALEDWL